MYMYRVFPLQVKMLIVSDGDNGEIFLKQVKLLLLSIIHQQHANVFWVRHNALKNNFKISANYKFFVKSISRKNSWNQFHEKIREINYTKNFALFCESSTVAYMPHLLLDILLPTYLLWACQPVTRIRTFCQLLSPFIRGMKKDFNLSNQFSSLSVLITI